MVSGVTGWGLYVELANTVEGLISVTSLDDDYYRFDETGYCLRGNMTGRVYSLGQEHDCAGGGGGQNGMYH